MPSGREAMLYVRGRVPDNERWGVVEVVGSMDEERGKTFGGRTAASEFV